ncbi:Hypothetical_protein [Hexamita inflata]|uniref:Hypothetical_protein n=1 Tax=Hexamita inflata TaxID=28002 RepID=A0AA86NX16_9EUKA|nr:Hypothetical protein HINF_LOCUS15094 [Hexamita inflata]
MRNSYTVIVTPLSVFNNPYPARIMSYLSIVCLVAGIVLMITSTTVDKIEQFGFIAGGAFIIVVGFALGALSMQSCRAVQSVKYIMMPCCVSETERKALGEQALARTQVFGMMPVVVTQQQVNYQQQVGGYQAQVQPMIVQAPMYNSQFVNQQQNMQDSRQIPNTIAASDEIMSVM